MNDYPDYKKLREVYYTLSGYRYQYSGV